MARIRLERHGPGAHHALRHRLDLRVGFVGGLERHIAVRTFEGAHIAAGFGVRRHAQQDRGQAAPLTRRALREFRIGKQWGFLRHDGALSLHDAGGSATGLSATGAYTDRVPVMQQD